MDVFDVDAGIRTALGGSASKKLKRDGLIPGILYSGDGNIPLMLKSHEISTILSKQGEDVFLDLNLNGESVITRVHDVQRDPVNQEIQHIDLVPVTDDRSSFTQLH